MESVSKQQILNLTHYGTSIYSHILRQYYPAQVVMKITNRDCGLCRNPFNEDKQTLHIWIEKDDSSNPFSCERALHSDSDKAIPDGDAFDFAALHYQLQGNALLQAINKDMNLRIGANNGIYSNTTNTLNPQNTSEYYNLSHFSFFRAPISNTKPLKAVSLPDIYKYIVGDYAKANTEKLREMLAQTDGHSPKNARLFKAGNFCYCTFSGTFTARNDKALILHSGLLCVDFDHLSDVSTLFNQLLKDEYFDTQLLFRSPSGDGLKWIIPIDLNQATHSNYFTAVANYISQTYGVEVDKSGKDISRACFLPHDPQAFINPKFKI